MRSQLSAMRRNKILAAQLAPPARERRVGTAQHRRATGRSPDRAQRRPRRKTIRPSYPTARATPASRRRQKPPVPNPEPATCARTPSRPKSKPIPARPPRDRTTDRTTDRNHATKRQPKVTRKPIPDVAPRSTEPAATALPTQPNQCQTPQVQHRQGSPATWPDPGRRARSEHRADCLSYRPTPRRVRGHASRNRSGQSC